MHPHLMGAPGARPQFQPTGIPVRTAQPPFGDGLLAGGVNIHAPAFAGGPLQQWGGDDAVIAGGSAAYHGPVDFLDPARRERGLRFQQRRLAQRDHKTSGGVGIQSMRQPWAVAATGKRGEAILHAGTALRAGMHGGAGGLVQYCVAEVAEQDFGDHAPLCDDHADRPSRVRHRQRGASGGIAVGLRGYVG